MEQFKRAQVILLPTTEVKETDTFIIYKPIKNVWGESIKGKLDSTTNTTYIRNSVLQNKGTLATNSQSKNQFYHLYIISDDEIQEDNDYFIGTISNKIHNSSLIDNIVGKKIIAATDKSLILELKVKANHTDKVKFHLPQPSQQFIDKYIEEYNKGNIITDILVEYNKPCCTCDTGLQTLRCSYSFDDNCIAPNPNNDFYGLNPKVNPKDNTITIKRIKDSWTKEEVIKIAEESYEIGINNGVGDFRNDIDIIDHDEWMKNNI